MLEVVVGVLVGVPIALAVRVGLVLHARRMALLRWHRAQFFEHAEALLGAGGSDDAALLRLKTMAEDIDRPAQFDVLWSVVRELARQPEAGTPGGEGFANPEWIALNFHYFLAVSYLRGLRGLLLRSTILRLFEPGTGGRNADLISRRVHPGRWQPA